MFNPDLATICEVDFGPKVRAVGWLGTYYPFPVGSVEDAFVERLRAHISSAWQPPIAGGKHYCKLCPEHGAGGSVYVWFPTPHLKYVAPELIVHYIESHCYRPPEEFIQAVMSCPPQGSDEFFGLLSHFDNYWDRISRVDLSQVKFTKELLDCITSPIAYRYRVLPVASTPAGLSIAMREPIDSGDVFSLTVLLRCDVFPCIADATQIETLLPALYKLTPREEKDWD
jgi:hypothetical protein